MSVSLNDMMISERSKMAELNHEVLEKINSFFATISDATIRRYYNTDGETMFEPLQKDLNYFRVNVPDNLERIRELKQNNELNPEQKKKLDDSENLAKDTLEMLDDTQNIIKNIMEERLNNAIMGPTLEDLARETLMKHKIPPGNPREATVLYKEYGGFRNRKNKTNNKKYAKKTTCKGPKKRVSKKIKTRKMKKNYL